MEFLHRALQLSGRCNSLAFRKEKYQTVDAFKEFLMWLCLDTVQIDSLTKISGEDPF